MKDTTAKPLQPIQAALSFADESHQLRQENDILTNKIVFLGELVQQLRDEIAVLKGQKPRPKFPPSKLESKHNSSDQPDNPDPNKPSPKKKEKPGQPKGKKRKKKRPYWKFTMTLCCNQQSSLKAPYLKATSDIQFKTS